MVLVLLLYAIDLECILAQYWRKKKTIYNRLSSGTIKMLNLILLVAVGEFA